MSQFPQGYFFIRSVLSDLVLDVSGGSTQPGAKVILWSRKEFNFDNQLWTYSDGFLINKASGLVLEVPGYEGGGSIRPGTSLVVNQRRDPPESLNQLWAYNYQMLMPYDPKVAITAKNEDFKAGNDAVVGTSRIDDPRFEWSFEEA